MTTDPSIEREEAAGDAADLWTHQQGYAMTGTEWGAFAQGYLDGAASARAHLAAQEPTHEEVIAATLELYVRSHHSTGRQAPFESLGHEEQVSWVMDGRAVLSAARAVGRDAQ